MPNRVREFQKHQRRLEKIYQELDAMNVAFCANIIGKHFHRAMQEIDKARILSYTFIENEKKFK